MSYVCKAAAAVTAASALAAAGGASAALPVVGAVRLEITSAVPNYLQIIDVRALELGSLDNVASAAEGATATAVSAGFSTAPIDAIDAYEGTPYYSASPEAYEKLTIFLARSATLTSLSIMGRDNCCRDRDFWNVSLFDARNNVLFAGQMDARTAPGSLVRVDFDAPVGGVPEPATWVMMIMGFGAAGTAIRRRRMVPA